MQALETFYKYISCLPWYPYSSSSSNIEWKQELLAKCLIGDSEGPQVGLSSKMPIEEWPESFPQKLDEFRQTGNLKGDSPDVLHLIEKFRKTALAFMSRIPQATLCITNKGLVGIVPGEAKKADKIFIANGAKVPFLVRKRPVTGKKTKTKQNPELAIVQKTGYEFIGEAYIHGIMYHEEVPRRQVEEICLI